MPHDRKTAIELTETAQELETEIGVFNTEDFAKILRLIYNFHPEYLAPLILAGFLLHSLGLGLSPYLKRVQCNPLEKSIMTKFLYSILGTMVVLLILFFTLGIFVVSPIGAIPEGKTIIYVRAGTKMKFISSVEAMSYPAGVDTNAFSTLIVLSQFSKQFEDKILFRLAYNETLYDLSLK